MKRLTAVLVVVLAVSAAILMYSSTQESRGEAIIHAAEARLAELSEIFTLYDEFDYRESDWQRANVHPAKTA